MIWLLTLLSTATLAAPGGTLQDRILKAFSARDGTPSCEDVAAWASADEVATAMRQITETVTMPPWAPMQAAQCVAQTAASDKESWDLVQRWMVAENTAGFALVVMQNADKLDSAKAKTVATLAVRRAQDDARFSRLVRSSMKASRHAVVVDVAKQLP